MATYYRTGVETYSIIGTADEKGSLEGRIPDGSTYFAVDENMFYTFYGGTWYETLPEAARLYHDDVGTDTKPIKLVGGVATVVANELAENIKVVHLAGTETITGTKTFTSDPKIKKSTALLSLESTQDSSVNAWKGRIVTSDLHNNVSTAVSDILFGNLSAGNYVSLRAMNPSRDGTSQAMAVYNHGDHMSVQMTAPYYPVDGSNNPQPLPNTHVETSGNITVDPRLVHTTGNETIAGTKTFSGLIKGRLDITVNSSGAGFTLLYRRTISTRAQWLKGFGGRTRIDACVRDGAIQTHVFSDSQRIYDQPIMFLCTDSAGTVTVWMKGRYSAPVGWYIEANSLYGSDYTTGIEIDGTNYSITGLNVGDATPYDDTLTFTSVIESTDFAYKR